MGHWKHPDIDEYGSHDLLSEFREPPLNIEQIVAPYEYKRARIARNTGFACGALLIGWAASSVSHHHVTELPYSLEWRVPVSVQSTLCAGISCMPTPRLVPVRREVMPASVYSVLDPADKWVHVANNALLGVIAASVLVGYGLCARTVRLERDAVFAELNKPLVHKYYWSI